MSRPRPRAAAAPAPPGGPAGAPGRVVISSFGAPGSPFYGGGGAGTIGMIARRLAREFQVTVVTAGRRRKLTVRDGVRYRYLPIGWAGPRGSQLLFHAVLPLLARRLPHDLWIENFTAPFSTGFLPLFSPAPVIGVAQALSGEEMWRRYRIPFFLIERFGLRFYRDVVVLNPADGERVRRCSPAATVRVIPNSVDLPPLAAGQAGRGTYILYLGRVQVWEKGLDLLLAAYARSRAALPLLLAGSGTRAEERRLAPLLAAAGRQVRWLGPAAGRAKERLIAGSAFLVLPSRHEAFGIAALEGMARGKPVVHFDLPSLRWMGGDVRVPPFDTGVLARELARLSASEAGRRRLGRQAHAVAQGYGSAEMTERYCALVRQRLAPGPAAGGPGSDPA